MHAYGETRLTYDHRQSIKEVIRHGLFRCGLTEVLDSLRRWRGKTVAHLRKRDAAEIFSSIYADRVWVMHKDQHSLSGAGSTQLATGELVVRLSEFLKDVDCQRLVDVGCGDFNWMRNVEGDFDYLGIDVVAQVIETNNATYGTDRRRFVC